MLIMGVKPGHDGALAVIEDRRLILCLESEKDSFQRHSDLTPMTFLDVARLIGRAPDVVAVGGWRIAGGSAQRSIGAGYHGVEDPTQRPTTFFGKEATLFSSSHVRSHIMAAIGMAPRNDHPLQAVLVWEGVTGGFYLIDERFRVVRSVPVLTQPGARYAFLFAIADETFPDSGAIPNLDDSGKLMALAAYGNRQATDGDISQAVERILKVDTIYPAPKEEFRTAPFYNAGVDSEIATTAAALLSRRIFQLFAEAAEQYLPAGVPLRIAGGCGLNCEWNSMWRRSGYFSSVFVPPCPNDSGSALGTAIDALHANTGTPYIDWDVYSGLDFNWDTEPAPDTWRRLTFEPRALAQAISDDRIVAWVQGRWEIGPRALGGRSILAEPFNARTRDRLNAIKKREDYRPIAPSCRIEDVGTVFHEDFPDPYMLYFRTVRSAELRAVTHVDNSARVQTVSQNSNRRLHDLLSAFAGQRGVGVLCNTSLNFKTKGFINKMSDLLEFCDTHGLDDIVVDGTWFQRRRGVGWSSGTHTAAVEQPPAPGVAKA
ncbi:MAG: 3-hydroxymethylcephem carbamoyltransferase [Actinoallomurus sp.]|nr:3-hydroxymethylcephem carbamoyltransferase [Actinoallomurus sp.]